MVILALVMFLAGRLFQSISPDDQSTSQAPSNPFTEKPIHLADEISTICFAVHAVLDIKDQPSNELDLLGILGLDSVPLGVPLDSEPGAPGAVADEKAALIADALQKTQNQLDLSHGVPPRGGSARRYLDAVRLAAGVLIKPETRYSYLAMFPPAFDAALLDEKRTSWGGWRTLTPAEEGAVRLRTCHEICGEIWERLGLKSLYREDIGATR